METISSRRNPQIIKFRALSGDREARRVAGEYVCDGEKLLREAVENNADVRCVLWGSPPTISLPDQTAQFGVAPELLRYVSPLINSPGPLFTVEIPAKLPEARPLRAIVLENVQDPGNVGTVIRTANALGTELVILVGTCADLYNPKTVRAAMGALFRQRVLELSVCELRERLRAWNLMLWGAALSEEARDIRSCDLSEAAVAIGNEGRGLSAELLELCAGEVVIPMSRGSESLNAATAASIVMWEACR